MRSAGSTYLELDLSVVSRTKARTAALAGPSFHDGSGSSAALENWLVAPTTAIAADPFIKFLRVRFIAFFLASYICSFRVYSIGVVAQHTGSRVRTENEPLQQE